MKSFRRGDTIIEVMLAMAIIGLILAAAYTTTSRNLRTSRLTQERTNALKIAESQIELMKSLAGTNRASLYSQAGNFCIVSSSPPVVTAAGSGSCAQSFYNYWIQRTGTEVFSIFVQWTPPGGSVSNPAEAKMVYRYPQ